MTVEARLLYCSQTENGTEEHQHRAAAEGAHEQGRAQQVQDEAAADVWRQAGGEVMPQPPGEAAVVIAAQGEECS